jgi:hypothetical protein
MIGWSAISLIAPFVPACIMVRLALGRTSGGLMGLFLQFFLSLGVALGISSCTYFLWLAKPVPGLPGLFPAEVVVFSLLCIAPFCVGRPLPFGKDGSSSPAPPRSERAPLWLFAGFGLISALAVWSILALTASHPEGGWDAWAIWNLRARALFRGGSHWVDGFSPLLNWSHPDYPLLIPATIARWWTYTGFETIRVPQFIGIFFALATAGLLVSSISMLRSVRQGLVAGLFLLSTRPFIIQGASQYADVPIGFFMLATAVAFSLKDSDQERSALLYSLAGITAGLAAWTKNEGMLFILALCAARIVSAVLVKKEMRKGWIKEILFFLAGLAPILAVIVFFKLRYAPPNELFQGLQGGAMPAGLMDVHRYAVIGKAFLSEIVSWGEGSVFIWGKHITISLGPILLVYMFLSGIRIDARNRRAALTLLIILTFMLCGHFLVYAISPYDLVWHLSTSVGRLLLQLWPTLLFAVFLIVAPLEDAGQ